MKKILFIISLICVSIILLYGCFKYNSKNNSLAYTTMKVEKISNKEQLSTWILNNKHKEGFHSQVINGQTYLLIVGKKQNDVGYNINLKELYSDEDYLYVDYSIIESSKDSTVTDAVYNPFLILRLKGRSQFERVVKI